MRMALLQLNPVVGDLGGNAARIKAAYDRAVAAGAELCVAPELAVTGYPPRDMLLYAGFAAAAWEAAEGLARSVNAAHPGGPPLVFGCPEPNRSGQGKPLFNSALWCEGGHIRRTVRKALLPTYDVFDEARYFQPGDVTGGAGVVAYHGVRLGLTICEDLWNDKDYWPHRLYAVDPAEAAAAAGARAIVNISASPFSLRKQALRQDMLGAIAKKRRLPIAYCNQVGGDDDLLFDGRSAVFGPDGVLRARAAGFAEDMLLIDLFGDEALPLPDDDLAAPAETWRALVLGTRDYMRKCGFQKALVGLSGGIDSSVVACVAAEAVGPENVLGVLMPSPWSSRGSVADSLAMAQNLGVPTRTIPIAGLMKAFDAALAESFAGLSPDATEENIQSRIRGNLLMALSNKTGALLLTTGNKSELAVGYCTIYGDMSGGFAVISDLRKTQVYDVARRINALKGPAIPESVLTKAPSAELKPDQKDEDSLPPYAILDAILALHIDEQKTAAEIAAQGFDPAVVARVCRLVKISEFKRRQAAPGIKIAWRSFGAGWRMPLAAAPLP